MAKKHFSKAEWKKALSALARDWETEWEAQNAGKTTFSESFRQKMKEVLRTAPSSGKAPHARGQLRWAAALLMLLLLAASLLFVDRTAYARMADWFRNRSKDVFEYRFAGDARDGKLPKFRLSWWPEGGVIDEDAESPEVDSYSFAVLYEEPEGYVTFDYGKYYWGFGFNIDPLQSKIQEDMIWIRGKLVDRYIIGDEEECHYVYMDDENMLYFLFSSTFPDEVNRKIIEEIVLLP